MLVLNRKVGDSVRLIHGDIVIELHFTLISGRKVRVAIDAPKEVLIQGYNRYEVPETVPKEDKK